MKVLDLFSGIGGFSLGLERAGFQTVAFCEIKPSARAILARQWPEIPIYDDVQTLTAAQLAADGIAIDAIAGGFPCQDISQVGKGRGIEAARSGLWGQFARLIGELRPRFVIVENVSALLDRGMGRVLGDLARLGYDAEWHCIPAAFLGAPHQRERIWIIAYPEGAGLEGQGRSGEDCAPCPPRLHIAPIHRGDVWGHPIPDILRMDDGLPDWVGRISGCGNAVVPQIPEMIGRAIMAAEAA